MFPVSGEAESVGRLFGERLAHDGYWDKGTQLVATALGIPLATDRCAWNTHTYTHLRVLVYEEIPDKPRFKGGEGVTKLIRIGTHQNQVQQFISPL